MEAAVCSEDNAQNALAECKNDLDLAVIYALELNEQPQWQEVKTKSELRSEKKVSCEKQRRLSSRRICSGRPAAQAKWRRTQGRIGVPW